MTVFFPSMHCAPSVHLSSCCSYSTLWWMFIAGTLTILSYLGVLCLTRGMEGTPEKAKPQGLPTQGWETGSLGHSNATNPLLAASLMIMSHRPNHRKGGKSTCGSRFSSLPALSFSGFFWSHVVLFVNGLTKGLGCECKPYCTSLSFFSSIFSS